MVENHEMSFFGQKSALILGSGKYDGPLFLHMLKKKNETDWEKSSLNEGVRFSLNLLEIKKLLDSVQYRVQTELLFTHKYKNETKTLKIKIETTTELHLTFMMGSHVKPIVYPESAIFEDLLKHIYEEKLHLGTEKTYGEKKEETHETNESTPQAPPKTIPQTPAQAAPQSPSPSNGEKLFTVIRRKTEKAIQLELPNSNNTTIWVPLSQLLAANPEMESEIAQVAVNGEIHLKIPSWILEKNNL